VPKGPDHAGLTAREKLMLSADQLFYAEGIHTVGIDRLIEHAGVAKASLYALFGSKDDLVKAYLEYRAERRQGRITERIAKLKTPKAKILGVFDFVGEVAAEPGFRGCAFVNASAEGDEAKVSNVCDATRDWTKKLFTDLAREHGAKNPADVGRRLAVLYDGALTACAMDRDPARAKDAKAVAEVLLDAATR
jgi:AcrR family transcriptional regulator